MISDRDRSLDYFLAIPAGWLATWELELGEVRLGEVLLVDLFINFFIVVILIIVFLLLLLFFIVGIVLEGRGRVGGRENEEYG